MTRRGKLTDLPDRYSEAAIDQLDRRRTLAKIIHARVNAIEVGLGGRDRLSHGQRSLVKRAAYLEMLCERFETALAAGGAVNVFQYLAAVNTLSALHKRLGLRRVARDIGHHGFDLSTLSVEARKQLLAIMEAADRATPEATDTGAAGPPEPPDDAPRRKEPESGSPLAF